MNKDNKVNGRFVGVKCISGVYCDSGELMQNDVWGFEDCKEYRGFAY